MLEMPKTPRNVPEDKCTYLTPELDALMYEHIRVVRDSTFCPLPDDEIMVQNLFADLQNEKSLVDDAMCLNSEGGGIFSGVEDFPYSNEYYEFKTDCDSNARLERKCESEFEFLDAIFQGVDNDKNLQPAENLRSCDPGHLLDGGLPEKNSYLYNDPVSCCLQNSDSKCEPQSLKVDCGTSTKSNLPQVVGSLVGPAYDESTVFLDNMSVGELHEVFRSTFGRDTYINDKEWLKRRIVFGLQNFKEFDNDTVLVERGSSSNENEDGLIVLPDNDIFERLPAPPTGKCDNKVVKVDKGMKEKPAGKKVKTSAFLEVSGGVQLDGDDELLRRKRKRRPTRRYIEESTDERSRATTATTKHSNERSRSCNKKMGCSVSDCDDRLFPARMQTQFPFEKSSMMPFICTVESHIGSGNQLQPSIRRRGRPRKNQCLQGSGVNGNKELTVRTVQHKGIDNSEISEYESLGDMSDNSASKSKKVGVRRKHHRVWTLSEVVNLIEGVSRYGVGRWTEIKRLLFSSSAYRTSVDLKDKWRNLLRATGAHIHGKREVESRKKQMSLPIPQSVTMRVRELAIIYPYPRERKSRSPLLSATSQIPKDVSPTPISHNGRAMQRRTLK